LTDSSASQVPVCPAHPDRATYIRCTRCERPICPECMVPAPVGFQCRECVGSAAAQVPQPRTPVGAVIPARPTVTYALIGITVAVFLVQLMVGIDESSVQWGMWPARVAVNGAWWLLLTSAFLHGSFLHIAFNMYVLFALGPVLERVLGHGRYLVLYLVAALGGGVASFWFSSVNAVSVGASGAIFGLMGALVVAGRRLRYDIRQVLILLAINLVIGFIAPGVDWRAHLGGLVTGAAVAAVFVLAPRAHRVMWQVLGIAAILGTLVALFWVRVLELGDFLSPISQVLST
jgi:membrane associated rhomboid family serine protease